MTGPAHPLALGPLGVFLAHSGSMLVGCIGPDGMPVTANPGLKRWLARPDSRPADLAGALSSKSWERWRRASEGIRSDGRPRVVALVFTAPGVPPRRADPPEVGPRQAFRCLLTPGDGETIWIVGEPRRPESEAGGRRGARVHRHRDPGVTETRYAALWRARRRALRLARTDELTGLPNRRQANRWLAALARDAGRASAPLSCLMVDLDRFKAINDTFGHSAGDRALRAVARALGEIVRSGDRVARYGGEEFLVLLPETDLAGASVVAERLRVGLTARTVSLPRPGPSPVAAVSRAEPAPVDTPDPQVVRLGASIGAVERRPGEPPAAMIARADAALRRAKQAGRGRVVIDP